MVALYYGSSLLWGIFIIGSFYYRELLLWELFIMVALYYGSSLLWELFIMGAPPAVVHQEYLSSNPLQSVLYGIIIKKSESVGYMRTWS